MVVAATGFFDGVHRGHRAVLQMLKECAASAGAESAVVTFWPHPRNVLQQDASTFRLLNTLEEKKELIKRFGIDHFYVVPFNKEFSRLDASTFIKEYLIERFGVAALVIGYDHRLGNSSCGSTEELVRIVGEAGVEPIVVKEVLCNKHQVSSTQIRNAISQGDIERANEMLGYSYSLHGVVVLGNMIGRTIGFPTANMELYEPLKIIPANGVYYVRVSVGLREYDGICNVGNRPTIGKGNERTIETHILDFDEDIYGLDISVKFIERIRNEIKFDSIDALKNQISEDRVKIISKFAP